MRKKKSYS